jgi:hypothetical protein
LTRRTTRNSPTRFSDSRWLGRNPFLKNTEAKSSLDCPFKDGNHTRAKEERIDKEGLRMGMIGEFRGEDLH